jgi:hypothetical protein
MLWEFVVVIVLVGVVGIGLVDKSRSSPHARGAPSIILMATRTVLWSFFNG